MSPMIDFFGVLHDLTSLCYIFVGFSLSHTSLDYFSVTSISFLMAPLFQTIRFHVGQPTIFQVCLVDTVAPPALQFCTSSVKMGVLYAEQTLHKHFYSLTQTLRCQRVTAPQSYLFACNFDEFQLV